MGAAGARLNRAALRATASSSRGRGSITRPLPSTHGPKESTPSDSALPQAIPASLHDTPSQWRVGSAPVRNDKCERMRAKVPCPAGFGFGIGVVT